MLVWAVVVAGGRGLRFGGHKQFELLDGRRVLDWAVEAARSVAAGVVLVLPPGSAADGETADVVVTGGESRSGSVRAGLAAVPTEAGVVVIHDAVRPLAEPALFRAVVAALRDTDVAAAVPAVPMSDTVKRVAGDRVVATVPRDDLVTVQTPQAFRAAALRLAHEGGGEGTDDAALVEARGGVVMTVPGDPTNVKLTAAADLAVAEALLRHRAGAGPCG